MDRCTNCLDAPTCAGRVVCRCLQVTEDDVVAAITTLELRTVKEVRQATGAGDGCTACHHALRQLIEQRATQSSSGVPICSVK
jgi:bacterioferritin-associated ferredoxin